MRIHAFVLLVFLQWFWLVTAIHVEGDCDIFLSGTHKVMTAIIIVLPSKCCC